MRLGTVATIIIMMGSGLVMMSKAQSQKGLKSSTPVPAPIPTPILKLYYSMDGGKTFKTNLVTVAPPMYISYDLKGQPQITFSLAQLQKMVCGFGGMSGLPVYVPTTTGAGSILPH